MQRSVIPNLVLEGETMKALLKSRMIDFVEYDDKSKNLRIYFANGQRRELEGVPSSIFEDFIKSISPGRYYVDVLRGRF